MNITSVDDADAYVCPKTLWTMRSILSEPTLHAALFESITDGLFQGLKELRLRNREPFPVDPQKIDSVILTHAHLDHTGYLPVLMKQGFRGTVYCTSGTRDLCRILLPDSGRLQEEEAEYAKKNLCCPQYSS